MPELLAHLVGDYVLQNHWMAVNKTKFFLVAAIHAVFYTLPFLLLTTNPLALLIICGTHTIIDHWRIAKYWVDFYGIGVFGKLPAWFFKTAPGPCILHVEYNEAPPYLGVWLLIIVDNTLHMCINHIVLTTLP
jgi:hypothetical protein